MSVIFSKTLLFDFTAPVGDSEQIAFRGIASLQWTSNISWHQPEITDSSWKQLTHWSIQLLLSSDTFCFLSNIRFPKLFCLTTFLFFMTTSPPPFHLTSLLLSANSRPYREFLCQGTQFKARFLFPSSISRVSWPF